jgi:hypothetical protein
MMHSRTVNDVMTNIEGIEAYTDIFFSHGLPQPEAENRAVAQALDWHPDAIWLIDDDMHFPPGLLPEMLEHLQLGTIDVVVAHYPVARTLDALHIRDGVFESAGMGCVLITPETFSVLEKPYFRADTTYQWDNEKLVPQPVRQDAMYHGLHDVDFFQRLIKAGVKPKITETYAGQYNLLTTQLHKNGNNTQQEVETWILPLQP